MKDKTIKIKYVNKKPRCSHIPTDFDDVSIFILLKEQNKNSGKTVQRGYATGLSFWERIKEVRINRDLQEAYIITK